MSVWVYEGLKSGGTRVSGKFVGSREALLKELQQNSVVVTSLTESKEKLKPGPYRMADIQQDLEQLHYLLTAGLSLDVAISSVMNNTRRAKARDLWSFVLQKLKEGVPFSRAIQDGCQKVEFRLPPFYNNMLAVGEEVGDVCGSLKSVLRHLSFTMAMRREVFSALAYPAFLMSIAIVTLGFIAGFILPRFSAIYSAEELTRLPWLSQVVLGAGHALRSSSDIYVVAALLLVSALFALTRPAVRKRLSSFIWVLPLLRETALLLDFANFFSALGEMLKGGVDLSRALRLSSRVVSCPEVASLLNETDKAIKEGQQISQVWRTENLVPEEVVSLVAAGEAGARLPEVFSEMSSRFIERFKSRVKISLTFLEPLIVVFLGAFIGIIVVAIMLAVVSMSDFYG